MMEGISLDSENEKKRSIHLLFHCYLGYVLLQHDGYAKSTPNGLLQLE